jgi:hypothetical protein
LLSQWAASFGCNLNVHNAGIIAGSSKNDFKGLAITLAKHPPLASGPTPEKYNSKDAGGDDVEELKDGLEMGAPPAARISDEDEKDGRKLFVFQKDLKVAEATYRHSLSWFAEHVKSPEMAKRWIAHCPERGVVKHIIAGVYG